MDVKKEIEENINEENIIKILKHYNCNPVVNINATNNTNNFFVKIFIFIILL